MRGKRGPGGGYTLARPPKDITLRDVIEAVEGPLDRLLAGALPGAAAARPGFLWPRLAEGVGEALSGIDLERLCRDAARLAVPRAHAESPMYHI